jgi:hypothetical protein
MTFAKLATIYLSKAESNILRRKPARRRPVAMYFVDLKDLSVNRFCRGSPYRAQ